MANGEYLYKDYYGEEIKAKDENELWEILDKRLNEIVRDAEKEGWDCEDVDSIVDSPSLICVKGNEDEGYYEVEIGYDIEEISD